MKFKKARKAINEKDLTINRVAIEAGITPSSLYAAFNGKVDFFPGWKKRVADVLGESVDSLFPEGCEADEYNSYNRSRPGGDRMITECRPENNIKFDVMVMRRGWDHVTGLYYYEPEKRLVSICSQDLTDIVESATRTPGVEIHIQRAIPIKFRSTRWS